MGLGFVFDLQWRDAHDAVASGSGWILGIIKRNGRNGFLRQTCRINLLFGSEWHFWFELMPCALEAQTVIKTCCLWMTIHACGWIGESKFVSVIQIKNTNTKQTNKQHPPKTKPNKNRDDTQEKSEHYAFRRMTWQISLIGVPREVMVVSPALIAGFTWWLDGYELLEKWLAL